MTTTNTTPPVTRDIARRVLPFLAWWPRVTRQTTREDLIAGLAGAIIVLPQGVAFATLAGMPPQYGLYAAMVPAIVAALFGSSWHLVSGPTNVISIFLFASLSGLADPGSHDYIELALTLTLLTGIMQLALGLARMGTVVNFISHTVVISFTAGAACLIFTAQLGNFFGVGVPRGSSFVGALNYFLTHLTEINPYVTAVGAITLATGILSRRLYPKFPYMISAMLAGGLFAAALNLAFGADVTAIRMVGQLPGSLPQLSMPDLSAETVRKTLPIAFAVTILALTEAVSIARAIAVRTGQRIDGNQEFIGQGLSNIAGAFFSGYASSGSFNRSGANYDAGARTPLAAVFSALILIVLLVAVAPLSHHLPLAVMGAILFMVAWGLVEFKQFRTLIRASRQETAVMIVTFGSAIFADLEFAIYAGVLLSLLLYLTRTARPAVTDVKPDPAPGSYHFSSRTGLPDCPQLKIVRVSGSLFFGAVDHVQGALESIDARNPGQRHALIVAHGINFVDMAGGDMLAREARRRQFIGGGLYFYQMRQPVYDFLAQSGLLRDIGPERVFPVRSPVIEAIYPRLDSGVCSRCERRIFALCRERLPDGSLRPAPTRSEQSTEKTMT